MGLMTSILQSSSLGYKQGYLCWKQRLVVSPIWIISVSCSFLCTLGTTGSSSESSHEMSMVLLDNTP